MKDQTRLKRRGPGESPFAKEIPLLIAALRSPHNWLDAAIRLGEIGEEAVAPLIESLSDPAIDSFAYDAITRIGKPAVPALIEMFATNKENRDWAGQALNCIIGYRETLKLLGEFHKANPKV